MRSRNCATARDGPAVSQVERSARMRRSTWTSLRAQAATLGIADRVEFLGDRSDIPRLLAGVRHLLPAERRARSVRHSA